MASVEKKRQNTGLPPGNEIVKSRVHGTAAEGVRVGTIAGE